MSSAVESSIHSKRSNSELTSARSLSPVSGTNKRHELDSAPKPGRKPLQSEPKNKRTAQNRALQRLFRERKERRMKELEDKVADLEGEKLELHNESEFLRIQVETLMSELKKFRGDTDITNLLPKKVPAVTSSSLSSNKNSDLSGASNNSTPLSSNDSPGVKKEELQFEFPTWNGNSVRKQPYRANTAISSESSNSVLDKSETNTPKIFNNPGLISGNNDSISSNSSSVSTSDSPNNDLQDLGITKDDELFPIFGGHSLRRSSILSNEVQADEPFDEKLNEFCLKLSEACGSKSCPIPKNFSTKDNTNTNTTAFTGHTITSEHGPKITSPFNFDDETPLSPFNHLITEQIANQSQQQQQQQQQQDSNPYSFLDQTPFDPSIAFDINDYGDFFDNAQQQDNQHQQANNLDNLVTEESLYDPLGMFGSNTPSDGLLQTTKSSEGISPLNHTLSPPTTDKQDAEVKLSGNLVAPTLNDNEDDNDDDVVPSSDGNLMKCSAIWDRITQHPRYTEIDIEGLCTELKQKLKCSEKGAVVDSKDVSKLLDGNYLFKNQANTNKNWFM